MTAITALPEAPSRGMSAAEFITKANAFLAALPTMRSEFNAAFAALATGVAPEGTVSSFVADDLLDAANAAAFLAALGGGATGIALLQAATALQARNTLAGPSEVLLNGDVTGSGGPVFALSSADGWNRWELELMGVIPSAAAYLTLQFSFDNQSSWKAGASDYCWNYDGTTTSSSYISGGDDADTLMRLGSAIATTANRNNRFTIDIFGPRESTFGTSVEFSAGYLQNGGLWVTARGGGEIVSGYEEPTHVRIVPNTGTVDLRYVLKGQRAY